MKNRLIQAGLWGKDEFWAVELDIVSAWKVLSRLGYPSRYGGKTLDGYHEFLITDPHTGSLLTSGRGMTLEMAICNAALNASRLRLANDNSVATILRGDNV